MPPRARPLTRATGLAHTGALRRVAFAVTTARPRRTGFGRATKALILDRDGWACVCCGLTVAQVPLTVHHRRNRGAGGSRDPRTNGPANGIACCRSCNDLMEASAARATEARARGWKLVHGQDPHLVPVVDWAGRAWLLDAYGQRRPA